jgi:DNA-binding NarL/FixJ family response regulator
MSDGITVLLVDDHAVVRQGVRAFLATQPDLSVVGEAGTGAVAVALAAQHSRVVLYETDDGAWEWPREVAAKLNWDPKQLQIRPK